MKRIQKLMKSFYNNKGLCNMENKFDLISAALDDLKQGKVIIVCDDEKRENEGDFVVLAEFATPEVINFMITHGRGLVCMPLTKAHADKIGLGAMVGNNTDNFKTAFTVSVDHVSNSTGISAFDRSTTVLKLLEEDATLDDFGRPGHMFPLIAKPLGVLERNGHTEAAVDLAILCGKKPAGVLCEIINADGSMARYNDLLAVKNEFNLKMISISDLIAYRKYNDTLVKREAHALLPTKYGSFSMVGYSNILDEKEHVALIKGDLSELNVEVGSKIPLVRLHSECLTGDIFHSMRCDCGEQLDNSIKLIEANGLGVILYLRQEGRGIGLINKLKSYELQENGLDTVEANHKLGFATDLREYIFAAKILQDLKIKKIRLITNNPEKISELQSYGIEVVEVINLASTIYPENKKYLEVKTSKLGHALNK